MQRTRPVFKSLRAQRRSLVRALTLVYVPVGGMLAAVAVLAAAKDVPLAHFLRDTTAAAGVPYYTGALSVVGLLLWCAAAAICFFSWGLLRSRTPAATTARFLLHAGLLTTLLLVDDAFLVHERIAPIYLGLQSEVVFAIYGLLGVLFLARHRQTILQSDYALLLLGGGLLVASIGTDLLDDAGVLTALGLASEDARYLMEDGFKLLGIAGWGSYFGWYSHVALSRWFIAHPVGSLRGS